MTKILLTAASVAMAEVNVPSVEAGQMLYDPRVTSEMDNLADGEELAKFVATLKADWTVFVEDREHSVRKTTGLPMRWLKDLPGHTGAFEGAAHPGEFYVFQVGVFAARAATGPITIRHENLPGSRCISLGGTDYLGRPFTKPVSVEKGKLQALWFGVDVPKNAAGPIHGRIIVTADGASQSVDVKLNVGGDVLPDHGDRDSWRLSRLRWLDSTLGLDDDIVTQPFTAIVRDDQTLKIIGRELVLGNDGLPLQFRSFFNADNTGIEKQQTRALLSSPFRFVVETDTSLLVFDAAKIAFTREMKGAVDWRAEAMAGGVRLDVEGLLEYDGFVDMHCRLTAARPLKVKDIRLEVSVEQGADEYFMGLGHAGGLCPSAVDWEWNPKVNQDGFWIGAVNGGFKLQLYGANWRTPLINCYYHWRELMIPESWGTGGIRVEKSAAGTKAVAYTGARELASGQPMEFNFKLFLTPFKPLNTEEQWALRYHHRHQGMQDPIFYNGDQVKAIGANVINIHHNLEPNPTINYPYFELSMPLLRKSVASGHANGVKVKVYYTTREITSNLPELFAFWSMNGEIICASPGLDGVKARPLTNGKGPHPWLIQHLGETGYIPAWREVLGGRYNQMLDLAVITTPDSRLDNFYLEGLAFLLRETGIDGVYVDDTALGRKAFQRAHRIFEEAGKPLLADMHSWNHMDPTAGTASSAYVFMQNFPYYHRLWYGEGHNCNIPPDQMLVQQSGLPFGLMSEMLDHPNPWHGMVFGETARLGWSGDPGAIWTFWDTFGMAGTKMHGWWNPACPVKTGNPAVPATVYTKDGKSLIALASWAPERTEVKLVVDWKALGLDPSKVVLCAPAIDGFQQESVFSPTDLIPLEPNRGWLLIAEGK